MKLLIKFIVLFGLTALSFFIWRQGVYKPKTPAGTVIILNGPSGSGKTSIQKKFQQLMMPSLWLRLGIDGFFDGVMPEITPENMSFWQSPNPIRWVDTTHDTAGNAVVTLHVGEQGDKVVYAMNSAIAAYAAQGCNVIVDYIAYDPAWVKDLQEKLRPFKTYYVAVTLPLEVIEQREKVRGTSPVGHARSHYATVFGEMKYDLTIDTAQMGSDESAHKIMDFVEKNK